MVPEMIEKPPVPVPPTVPSSVVKATSHDFIVEQRGVEIVAIGSTALVERLRDGNIIKSPWPSHGEDTAAELVIEANIYNRIGPHPRLVPIISCDYSVPTLTMEFMVNGTLKDYLAAHSDTSRTRRLRWVLEAAEGLQLLHSFNVVHYDVGPHNFLLDKDLGLKISDFGGSSVDGSRPTVFAGKRYAPPDKAWRRGCNPSPAGDLFGLGSTLYYIATGTAPFECIESDEVDQRFAACIYPAVDNVLCGEIIQKCWIGDFTKASDVVSRIMVLRDSQLALGI